jgi:hypothetical protein
VHGWLVLLGSGALLLVVWLLVQIWRSLDAGPPIG